MRCDEIISIYIDRAARVVDVEHIITSRRIVRNGALSFPNRVQQYAQTTAEMNHFVVAAKLIPLLTPTMFVCLLSQWFFSFQLERCTVQPQQVAYHGVSFFFVGS